jgi:hypothetical protein
MCLIKEGSGTAGAFFFLGKLRNFALLFSPQWVQAKEFPEFPEWLNPIQSR